MKKRIADATQFKKEKMAKSSLFESERFFLDVYGLEPGQQQAAHAHEGADKVYVVLEGRGTLQIGGERVELTEGQAVYVPAGAEHQFVGYEQLVVLVIFERARP